MNTVVTKEFTVENELGLHARPSASFVRIANEFKAHIEVTNEAGDSVNGKSILGLMCLSANKGTRLTVSAKGSDAEDAVFALGKLFKDKFGEM
jgi:phosphocarrier protein HPr